MLEQTYLSTFTPLVQKFIDAARNLAHPEIDRLPEPHLPLFGKRYHTSALRIVIVGQDTRGWGCLRDFIAKETQEPGIKLREGLAEFRDHAFTEWGNTRQTFWGFAMMFLAALHGQNDWGLMKRGKMTEILDSFAWAQGNAVELYGSTVRGRGVPHDYWQAVREAGAHFDRFRYIAETLKPDVALVLYRGLNTAQYFEGYAYEVVSRDGRLTHYRIPQLGTQVLHVPHPRNMNRIEGPDFFLTKLREIFLEHQITVPFPEFLTSSAEGTQVMNYLEKVMPTIGSDLCKYEFVARVAEELMKRDAFMSVPTLVELVNSKGGRTDYGDSYGGGRGSYRLVSATYHRMRNAAAPERAHAVAVAFRRPDFEYAYSED